MTDALRFLTTQLQQTIDELMKIQSVEYSSAIAPLVTKLQIQCVGAELAVDALVIALATEAKSKEAANEFKLAERKAT